MAKLFKGLVDYSKPGAGVKKDKNDKRFTFTNFFPVLGRRFWKLVSMNLLYVFFNFPVFFGLLGLSGNFDIPFNTPAKMFYPILYGAGLYSKGPAYYALMGVHGFMIESGYPSATTRILYYLTLLVLLTFGMANVGMAYVTRNFAKEEHADVGSDFFLTIKKNFFQGLLLGIVDIALLSVISFDLYYFYYMQSIGFGMQLMFYVSIGLGFIYAAMRFYMYIILVTFKLNTYKIIKNSFIFALLGIKRNLLAFIGILLTISINYFFYMMFPPIGVVMPFIITFSLCAFISAYAVYPIIKKYMIIPYYPDADKQPESDVEPVFVDRG